MSMEADKAFLEMIFRQNQEERKNRYWWFVTIILACTSTILFFSYLNRHSSYNAFELKVLEIKSKDIKTGTWFNKFPYFEDVNDRPIIGILTQELDDVLYNKLPLGHNYTSYLAASYVQWVMSGGARVVPIIIGHEENYYRKIFNGINGLLLPGGNAPLTGDGGYAAVGELFFRWAMKANQEGDFFPIWGTCNGFELLTVLSSRDVSRLTDCSSQDQAVPLYFLQGADESNLFGSAPPDVLREIREEKVTINFHNHCLTPTNFTKYEMFNFWTPLSWNSDAKNVKYLSSIEAIDYPFVGVQFHPEKNIYEWDEREPRIPHSRHAVHVSLYFSAHFVNMARKSGHSFSDRLEEEKYLSYNYKPHYVGSDDIRWLFEEAYLF